MPRFKYNVEMVYMPSSDSNKYTTIPNESIRKLYIDHNYKEANMPTMYCTLNIDKTLYDSIILGAKTDSILLSVYKIDVTSSTNAKLVVYNNKCEYFLNDDINYNKEIDYQEKKLTDEERKDIYREVNIGLMFKDCIERNKNTSNATFINSSMSSIVISELSTHPLLLEPFTYSSTLDQLIVPPQETAVKCISFLNDVKVFYETPYRFFIEPDCTYLVSSSGKPTQKTTDKYDTVKFVIYPPENREGNALGQSEDDKSTMYLVNVNANNTTMNINSNMAKQFNSVQAIINPSKDNSLAALSSVQNIINDINQIAGGISSVVNNALSTLENIPSQLTDIKLNFNINSSQVGEIKTTAVSAIHTGIELVKGIGLSESDKNKSESDKNKSESDKNISESDKNKIITALNNCISSLDGNSSQYPTIVGEYSKSMSNVLGIMGRITNAPSFLSGISAINAQSNTPALTKCITFISTESANELTRCTTTLNPYVDVANALATTCQTAMDLIADAGVSSSSATNVNTTLTKCKTSFAAIAKNTSINIATHTGFPLQFENMKGNFEPYMQKLKNVNINLAAQFTHLTEDLSTLGNNAKSMLQQIQNAGNDAANVLAKSGLSISSLTQLAKDINTVKDITSIGKLGISKFNFNLNLGRTNGTGALVYRIKNDNPNKAKNIKFEMENNLNTITISKDDLDTSLFNMNMKYIIKNYDAHSDKNGAFILDRKIEMFIREDNRFLCNLHMQFRMIPSNEAGSTEANAKTKSSEKTNETIVNTATKIADALNNPTVLKLLGNNNTVKSLAEAAKKYSDIQKSSGSNILSAEEILKKTIIH